jgi:hypothetical protein
LNWNTPEDLIHTGWGRRRRGGGGSEEEGGEVKQSLYRNVHVSVRSLKRNGFLNNQWEFYY